ncbi:MAG TPA: response regulator [Rhodospirillaceae bacterium]|nr:response regulator [Rhodospirillaceae bacterium]
METAIEPPEKASQLPLKLLLSFSDLDYERRFVEHYVGFYYRYAQASLVLGMVLIAGDFLVDCFAYPVIEANYFRLFICLPILLVGLTYSFLKRAKSNWQFVMPVFVLTIALSLFWILLQIELQGGAGLRSWVGILNFVFLEFYCFVILGVQFRYALVSGALILFAFEAALIQVFGLSGAEMLYWSYHVVTLFILAAGIGWWREYLLRLEFSARTALDAARRSAEHHAQAKSVFLANMSHEIRTPLNAVLGMARIGVRDSSEETSRRSFGRILDAGKYLLAVINDILDASRIEAGKLAIEHQPLQPAAVMKNAADLVAGAAQSKGLAYSVEAPENLPDWITGDAMRLRQILVNLLSNAVKFTEQGEVRLLARREGDKACFKVIDSGIGMTAEQLQRVFTPFEQADSSTTRRFGGSGLGLAISSNLARLMGGDITVESCLGQGSTFTVTLPLAESAPPPSITTAEAVGSSPKLTGFCVLVVEDVEANRFVLNDMLGEAGAQVENAENGRQAVDLIAAAAKAFDVVLMDVQMPEMDGYEATRRILQIAPGLPVIGLTAHVLDEEGRRGTDCGMVDRLSKPVDYHALVAAIVRHLPPVASSSVPVVGPGANAAPIGVEPQVPALGGKIDWVALDARFNGKSATISLFAQTVLKSHTVTPARLRDLAAARDFEALGILAHNLISTAGYLGTRHLRELAQATEVAARKEDNSAVDLAEQLAAEAASVFDELSGMTLAG